jgi:hypothetical protein
MYGSLSFPLHELIVSRSSHVACLHKLENFKAKKFSQLLESFKRTNIVLGFTAPALGRLPPPVIISNGE